MTGYSQAHNDAIQVMLLQLLIVLINRLGGEVSIPVKEIDETGGFDMTMVLNLDNSFTFKVTGVRTPHGSRAQQ